METLQYPTETTANKEHQCDFCGERITKGSKYLKSTHKFDGDIYDWKTHDYCNDIAHKLQMYDNADEGVSQDYFMENINEEYYELLTKGFAVVTPKIMELFSQLRHVKFKQKLHYVILKHK